MANKRVLAVVATAFVLTACAREVIAADRLSGLPSSYEVEILSEVECGSGHVQLCSRTFGIEYEGREDELLADLRMIGIDVDQNTFDELVVSEVGYAELIVTGVNNELQTKVLFFLVTVVGVLIGALLVAASFSRLGNRQD